MVGQDHDVELSALDVITVSADHAAQLNLADLIDLLCKGSAKCHNLAGMWGNATLLYAIFVGSLVDS